MTEEDYYHSVKDKANQLVINFLEFTIEEYTYQYAIKCALLAVEEIIEQWEYIDTYLANGSGELNPNLKYWYDVKLEINKLK